MADRITAAMQRLAGEAWEAFEQTKRGDETITVLRSDAPEWVRDATYGAHHGMFPDDWVYDKTQDAFGAIHDASDGADLQEVGDEFTDGAVDIYNAARLKWLESSLYRPAYCDDAREEGLISEDADILERIGMGQYMEAREIWSAVLNAVEDAAADSEDDD